MICPCGSPRQTVVTLFPRLDAEADAGGGGRGGGEDDSGGFQRLLDGGHVALTRGAGAVKSGGSIFN